MSAEAIAGDLLEAMGRKLSADGAVSFDPLTHVYMHLATGRELPSVTRLLEATGIREPYRADPVYGQRGSWVHACTELMDAGDLDWERAEADHADWLGYVHAYEGFVLENTVEILSTEEIVWSLPWWFAGTCDRTVLLNGEFARLDLKTGQPTRSDVVQLALYDMTDPGAPMDLRLVYLRKDGTYRAPRITLEDQEEARLVAQWAAGIMQWRGKK